MIKNRPTPDEYSAYAERYVSLVPGTDILETFRTQLKQITTLFAGRSERDGDFRYAPEKWSVKEVVGHMSDTERIFAYRALRIARGDKTPIEGFEQDDYIRGANFGKRKLADLVEEFADVRMATLDLFGSIEEEAWLRRGIANGNEVTVRGIAYVIGGHVVHHRTILEERYFPAIPRA